MASFRELSFKLASRVNISSRDIIVVYFCSACHMMILAALPEPVPAVLLFHKSRSTVLTETEIECFSFLKRIAKLWQAFARVCSNWNRKTAISCLRLKHILYRIDFYLFCLPLKFFSRTFSYLVACCLRIYYSFEGIDWLANSLLANSYACKIRCYKSFFFQLG